MDYAPSGTRKPDSESLKKLKKLSSIGFWWASLNVQITTISYRNGKKITTEKPTSGGHSIVGSGKNVTGYNWTKSPNQYPLSTRPYRRDLEAHAGFIFVPPKSWK